MRDSNLTTNFGMDNLYLTKGSYWVTFVNE